MDRPLTLRAHDVRAILDGKTQHRTLLKPTRSQVKHWDPDFSKCPSAKIGSSADYDTRWVQFEHPLGGPYTAVPLLGDVGDRLFVREAWQVSGLGWGKKKPTRGMGRVHYRATDDGEWKDYWGRWRNSNHMPRWASRITLLVTDVRVQRLQDISEEGCIAEGPKLRGWLQMRGSKDRPSSLDGWMVETDQPWVSVTPRCWYRELWNATHGPDAWDRNDWVVARTFEVLKSNIDEVKHG